MVSYEHKVKNIYLGEPGWEPGANTVAYYPLNSTSTVNDMSGNNNTLTNSGGVTFGTNHGVDCALFDGNRDHYLGATIPTLPLGDDVRTCSIWTYWDKTNIQNNYQDTLFWWGSGTNNKLWFAGIDGMTVLGHAGSYIIAGFLKDLYGESAHSKEWTHFVAVYDKTNLSLYINGTKTTAQLSGFNTEGNVLRMGGGTTWETTIYRSRLGCMSEFIIENKARTAQEVSDYFNQTKSNYGIS